MVGEQLYHTLGKWQGSDLRLLNYNISEAFGSTSEPMPAGNEHCIEDELACFRAAVDEAGYLGKVDEPFSSIFVADERDAVPRFCADVNRRGPDFLLQSAGAAIQGLSSYRRLWHASKRAFEDYRQVGRRQSIFLMQSCSIKTPPRCGIMWAMRIPSFSVRKTSKMAWQSLAFQRKLTGFQ